MYDAIEMSLHQLEFGRQAKKTLVVISDGGDNHSTHTQQEVMQDVLSSLATIYTVGIYDEDDPEKNEGVLKKLAHVSGGVFYHPRNLEDIVPICRQIAKDIRTRYTIGYVPSAEGKDGAAYQGGSVVAGSSEVDGANPDQLCVFRSTGGGGSQ